MGFSAMDKMKVDVDKLHEAGGGYSQVSDPEAEVYSV
jgi:hypothetical protein